MGFNFIDQCNNESFIANLNMYEYFTLSINEKIDIKMLSFVEFDVRYDAIYYNVTLNNSVISYYGNALLKASEKNNLNRVVFSRKIVSDYVKFLKFSNQSSSKEVFLHFWDVTFQNYDVKIEPADVFKR